DWKMSKMAALGALNWIVRWYSPKGKLSVDEIGEAMADFVLHGFGVKRNKK
ncbi:MAG: TetR/AcrR family transcriptional regulator, partial [Cyclobacteriaceae bacterium]|nr:TetR/AcrR family transcriptional regulator [Cyclobacteriaceae bacterium]